MSALLGRRRVIAAIIFVLVAVVATESVVLAATAVRQGDVEYMKVATSDDGVSTQSTSGADLMGTALAMQIPNGAHDFFQITFSANVSCQQVMIGPGGQCYVRAMVDGQQVAPGLGAFGNSSVTSQLAYTMQWASGVLAPGTHYVKIQFLTLSTAIQMTIVERTMTVVRVRAY